MDVFLYADPPRIPTYPRRFPFPCVQSTWKKFSFFDKEVVGEQVGVGPRCCVALRARLPVTVSTTTRDFGSARTGSRFVRLCCVLACVCTSHAPLAAC
jgi:hypothetical protein